MTTDESALYTLATRLIPRRYQSPAVGTTRHQLLAGQLPSELPFDVPVPPLAVVIGTVMDGHFTTVLLDTDLSPKQALDFYDGELTRTGWTALDTGRSHGGFEHANHAHGTFCRSSRGPKLTLNAHAYPDEATEIRLDLDLTPDEPCTYPRADRPHDMGPPPSLPELAPPAGATLLPMGGEASPVGTSSNAQLVTSLDLAAVAAHYANQMREAGCRPRDSGQGDDVAWSTWDLEQPDVGPAVGLFMALQQPNDRSQYFIYERVAWIPSASSNPGC